MAVLAVEDGVTQFYRSLLIKEISEKMTWKPDTVTCYEQINQRNWKCTTKTIIWKAESSLPIQSVRSGASSSARHHSNQTVQERPNQNVQMQWPLWVVAIEYSNFFYRFNHKKIYQEVFYMNSYLNIPFVFTAFINTRASSLHKTGLI